eukprot:TRINITY_DN6524_c0_g1_i1.p1 TRINITY_DN6524_c0_g1~~TRINITY_DN6524_c0_g1_i1.p1  ORF type:complete len:128 (+),score=59.97 TRINITY_DN6524_c0_g1_i1:111-494(+)
MCIRDSINAEYGESLRAKMAGAAAEDREEQSGVSQEAGQLDTLTDHHVEKELDASKVNLELGALQEADEAEMAAKRERARELAKVAVAAEDIDLVADQMDMSKEDAEQALRENEGDVKKTLIALVHA